MNKQVLFSHGGGQGANEADGVHARSLQNAIGSAYDVHYPSMPNQETPEYEAGNAHIPTALATLDDGLSLVGHSFGGSVLLKYLSAEQVEQPPVGFFLIASLYWGIDENWNDGDLALARSCRSAAAHTANLLLPQL